MTHSELITLVTLGAGITGVGLGVLLSFGFRRWQSKAHASPSYSRYASLTEDEVASEIARVTPYFAFKGIERFYDIGGFTQEPEVFQFVIDRFVAHYRELEASGQRIDKICGIDARGFIIGPPVALALGKPFFMLRKKGKMPNAVSGNAYTKEYAGDDVLTIPRQAVRPGDAVVVMDDLVATGGTLVAALELIVTAMGGHCVECACVVELKALKGCDRIKAAGFDSKIWAIIDESHLTLDGTKDPRMR